jgi:Domain of unknown function (DUF4382)
MLLNRTEKPAIFNRKTLNGHFGPILCAVLILAVVLSGCSGSGSGGSDPTADTGELVVGLTDAESDFVKYEVNVVSLTLTKQNGAEVDALPVATRVDFAQYVEMTEFLTAATIPVGRYVEAALELDYSDADLQVEGSGGSAVPVDTNNIVDDTGATISRVTVSVQLQGKNALLIVPGIPAHLTLDFDLSASNHVDLTDPNQPVVTVNPHLVAEVNPQNPKIHRLRGPLKKVNVAEGTFRLIIRPFIHVIAGGDDRFGTLRVVTDDDTVYDISGSLYQGDEGLQVLDQQQVLTAVIVIGDLNIAARRFEARQVYTGSSVPGGTLDVITGNVVSRSGLQLTVKGATLMRAIGSVAFNDELEILLSDDTTIGRQFSKDPYSISDISVGQRITVFGELNSGEIELDAENGHVHLLLTAVKGVVVGTDSPVIINLTAIDGRNISHFDFAGSGIDSANDADPTAYEVETSELDISGLETGDAVKFRGFVTPFGHAADLADFEARTLINVSNVKGLMIVDWFPPASDAIAEDISSNGFSLNLNGVGLFHRLNRAGVVTDLTQLQNQPFIEPADSDSGLYEIVRDGQRQFFFTFDSFVDELKERLTAGGRVIHVAAIGTFDDANAIMASDIVSVKLQ